MILFQSADRQGSEQAEALQATARADAAAAAREAAAAAQDAAASAREHARDQAQMMRDRAQIMRDAARMEREAFTPGISIRRDHGPSPQQERMLFSGFVIAVIAAVIILYPIMSALGRRLERGGPKANAIDLGSSDRQQRIEQAVDSMAIEIERISEGQRFATRLLTAKAEASAQPGR